MSDFYRLAEGLRAASDGRLTIRREVAGYTRYITSLDHPTLGPLAALLYEFEDEIFRIFVYAGDNPSRATLLQLSADLTAELVGLCERVAR